MTTHAAKVTLSQKPCACGASTTSVSGPCPKCEKRSSIGLQAKLRIGSAQDSLEAEADRVADRVMSFHSTLSDSRTTHLAQSPLIRRHTSTDSSSLMEAPPVVEDALRANGEPLDASTRAFFEPRFGHSFGSVRVHVNDEAVKAVQANAFAAGNHIVFASDQYQPKSECGRRLLAHELTHVVQQSPQLQKLTTGSRGGSGQPLAAIGAIRAGVVRRKDSGLLPPERVYEVFGYWMEKILKSRGTNVLTEAIENDVREKVKVQVGPGNFANWEKWERAQMAKIFAEAEAQNPKPTSNKPIDPQAVLPGRHDRMWADTNVLRAEVAQSEYLAGKLNFGGGVKGSTARVTAGAYTATWGIGARTATSVADHVPMLVLSTVGLVFGSELAEKTLVSQGQAVAREGEEMGADARTAVRLVGGDLQAAYEATRPYYGKYQKAFGDFTDASTRFKKDLQVSGLPGFSAQAKDIADMEAAMKVMREAGNEYLMACARLGIQTDAQALGKMGDHIVKGAQDAIVTAVTSEGFLGIAPSLREVKSAVKGAEGLSAKQLEKEAAEQVAKSIGKSADDAAAVGVRKSALGSTKFAAAKPGLSPGSPKTARSGEEAVLASHPGSPGHKVEVTAVGVKVCSPPPCPVIEVAYANELKAAPKLAAELAKVNRLRSTNASGAAEKAAALQIKLEGVRTKLAKSGATKVGLNSATKKGLSVASLDTIEGIKSAERQALESLDDDAWNRITNYARTNSNADSVKGKMAEELFSQTPAFTDARKRAIDRAKGLGLPAESVEFVRDIRGVAPTKKSGGSAQELTDGAFIAFHDKKMIRDGVKTVERQAEVLTVFESKSPSNLRDLARKKGEYLGQVEMDFERMKEAPTIIRGEEFKPSNVSISRTKTEWIGIAPPGESLGKSRLKSIKKGLPTFREAEGPVSDATLKKIAQRLAKKTP